MSRRKGILLLFLFGLTSVVGFNFISKTEDSEGGLFSDKAEKALSGYRNETVASNESNKELNKGQQLQNNIQVGTLLQLPELPNGCEITALTAVLNYYGYPVSKTDMADMYLPKQKFRYENNKLYGANPNDAFAGNPREKSGFFSFAPPIVKACNLYMMLTGGKQKSPRP